LASSHAAVHHVADMRRFISTLAIALATALGLLAAAPPSVSADEGYRQTAATVYRLDPANGRLRVTVTLKVTNRTPDSREPYSCIEYTDGWFPIPYPSTCYNTTRYYLTTTSALVENEATAIKAVSGGKRLAVANGAPGTAYRAVTVTFPKLYFGESRTVKLTYTVKGGKPRSSTATRTMRAFASFCAIANGTDSGTVTVRLPKGFAVTTSGDKLKAKVVGKERVLSSGKITTPEGWFACFSGTNRAGYKTDTLAAHDGREISLRSWPEDPAWAKGVRADIVSSLPLLERLTGTGMDREAKLSVQEAATGAEYAGFYDAKTGTITVGEDYGQPALVEHELAHVWFNRTSFKETWLSEGLAEWAGRAVSGESGGCTRPDATAGSVRLTEWRYLAPRASQEERDAVAAQYAAACWVVTAVATAAGDEGMTAAVSALLERRDPYAADPKADRATRVATWKDWLDAVDELALAPAGADETLASNLLVEYGVAGDQALFDERAAVRQAYRDLLAAAHGWVVPAAVRAPLAAWHFRDARAAVEAASRTWELTGETDAALPGVDARHGPAAEAWARATTLAELDAAADLADRQLNAARDVAEAQAMLDSPLDIAQQVGLFGTQVPSVDTAIPAVRAGDGDTVARITADTRATVAGLRATGQQRMVAGGTAALVLLAILAVLLVRRARQASLRRAEARASAATVAVAEAHQRPLPFAGPGPELRSTHPVDDSTTQVWIVPIVPSEADADLGSLVHKPPIPPPGPPPSPGR
jgi:hypothetical protein